jgi:uncharacterized integral membrane protein (TIGR00698 family)
MSFIETFGWSNQARLPSVPGMDREPQVTEPSAARAPRSARRLVPGLLLAAALALVASLTAALAERSDLVVSPLIVALLVGWLAAALGLVPKAAGEGLAWACRPLLRAAIVLLGFRLGTDELAALGARGLLALAGVVAGTIVGTHWLCRRLRLDPGFAWLLAAGHAICGAAAVAAVDAVLRPRERDAALALALVTLAGTVVMFACPLLARATGMEPAAYGFWVGGSVHEVAQAIAAGYAAGEAQGDVASVVKLARVGFLIPLGLLLAGVVARQSGAGAGRLAIPWFVFGFASTAVLRASFDLPAPVLAVLDGICRFAMATAMAALGAQISLRALVDAGARPWLATVAATLLVSGLAFIASRCLS